MKLMSLVLTLVALTFAVGVVVAQDSSDQPDELDLDASVMEFLGTDGGHIISFNFGSVGSADQSAGVIGGFGLSTDNTERGLEVRHDGTYQGLVVPPEGLLVTMPYPGTRATVDVYLPQNAPEVVATAFDAEGNVVDTIEAYWSLGLGLFDFYADDPILAAIELRVSGPGALIASAAITP